MASLDELRADLLRRLAKFLPMEESSAAATSSLSTTSPTAPVPQPATAEEAPAELVMELHAVPELSMPAPANCSTECQDKVSQQCEVASVNLDHATTVQGLGVVLASKPVSMCLKESVDGEASVPAPAACVPAAAILVPPYPPDLHVHAHEGYDAIMGIVPSVRVPPRPPDRRCTTQEQGASPPPSMPLSTGPKEPRLSWLRPVPTRPPDQCKAGPLPVSCRPPEQPHGTVFADGQVSLASQPRYDLAEDMNGLALCWKFQAGTSCHRIWWIAKNHYKIMPCVGKNTYCKQYGTYLTDLATMSVALVAVLRSTSGVVQFSMIWDPGITKGFMGVPYSPGNTIGVCPSACRETVMQQFMNSDHLNSLASYTKRQCITPSLVQLQNFIRGSHQFAVEVGLSTSKYFCCLQLSVKPKVEINGVTILCVELHVYSTCAWLSCPWKPGLHTWLWCCCRRPDRQVHNSIYGCSLQPLATELQYMVGLCGLWLWHNNKDARPSFSLEENTENGIMLMATNLHDCGYEFYSNQQSKLQVQLPRDSGDVHISAFCSIFAQSSICTLGRPWDPGIVAIREWQVQGDISTEVGAAAAICDRIDRVIAWGQAMFLGGGTVTTAHIDPLGLVALGRPCLTVYRVDKL